MSPDVDLSSLQAKAEELLAAIETKIRNLKNAPEGRLRIAQRESGVYYYHVTDSSPEWGDYLPQTESKTIARLAQKEYDQTVLAEMQRELKTVDRFLKSFCPKRLHDIFEKLLPARRKFVQPVRLPDEEFAEQWLSVKYSGKGMSADAPLLETSRGERVRSKSEVIIADTLDRLKIPYRYEFPHQLKVRRNSRGRGDALHNPLGNKQDGGRRTVTFHPDFTCLNVRTRREFIWEHFGRMDAPEYIAETLGKFETYTANGIFPGESLIFTMETQERPLNPATVEALARKYLQ
ncbi:MAG: hypothetical protein MJY98_07545 [Fibrobacter sp.]|nr:hypothetical protein [Fibrobacter sp.]